MNRPFIFFIFLLSTSFLSAQDAENTSIIEPFRIQKKVLSGLNIPRQKLADHPEREYFQKRIYQGKELSVFILSSETAINKIPSFPIDEFVYFMNGRADIETKDKSERSFYAGDYIFVPKGFAGSWTNNGGNKYHLELSVISNKRADKTLKSKRDKPFILDRELISGIGITEQSANQYSDLLYSGVELEVLTEAEKPKSVEIISNQQDQFIQVLSGVVHITPNGREKQSFYKGDFFILPKGFHGKWESEAQHLFRILKVIQKRIDV